MREILILNALNIGKNDIVIKEIIVKKNKIEFITEKEIDDFVESALILKNGSFFDKLYLKFALWLCSMKFNYSILKIKLKGYIPSFLFHPIRTIIMFYINEKTKFAIKCGVDDITRIYFNSFKYAKKSLKYKSKKSLSIKESICIKESYYTYKLSYKIFKKLLIYFRQEI